MKSIAELIHDAEIAKDKLEDDLVKMGLSFEDTVYDWYDNSMEVIDVPDEQRLSMDAQKILLEAGFSKVFLNHQNRWETHYTLKSGEEVKGWRVSYPRKRGDSCGSIWVEEKIDSWPKEWFETGYVEVKC